MYCVFVTIQVQPQHVEAFMAATRDNHLGSIAEPGCQRFDVLRDNADPSRFYLYEVYGDEAAFIAHQQTAHYHSWKDTVAEWMAAPRSAVKMTRTLPGTD